jgi:predicted hydrocarbon binding protein
MAPHNKHMNFVWENLGDIKNGRPHLGEEVPVMVYRIYEYAIYDILSHELGEERAQELIRAAGLKAGHEFALHALDVTKEFNSFIADLVNKLITLRVGVLRIEDFDSSSGRFTVTVAEDLDCSGLPETGEVVCHYDEGFIAGIFEAYTNKKYTVREIDCWATGDKVCRFKGEPNEK